MASQQSYGSRRMVDELSNRGITVGRFKVRRMMRQAGLKPVWRRKFIHTTDSKHDLPIAANILARRFNPTAPATIARMIRIPVTSVMVAITW